MVTTPTTTRSTRGRHFDLGDILGRFGKATNSTKSKKSAVGANPRLFLFHPIFIVVVRVVMNNSKCDIGINLQGVILRTNRAILTRFPESMLGKMFSSDGWMEPSHMDNQGNYLMDNDPEVIRMETTT